MRAADALFAGTRQKVLALLFGRAGATYYTREIVDRVGMGVSQVQRELERLTRAGLVLREPRATQVFYRANPAAAVFPEVGALMDKLAGLTAPARDADEPKAIRHRRGRAPAADEPRRVERAARTRRDATLTTAQRKAIARIARAYGLRRISLFGSAARGEARERSDVDLLVEFDPGRRSTLWEMPELQDELAKVFGRHVDLATPEILENPYRRAAVLRDLTEIYGRGRA